MELRIFETQVFEAASLRVAAACVLSRSDPVIRLNAHSASAHQLQRN
jgi:hypothetical protein